MVNNSSSATLTLLSRLIVSKFSNHSMDGSVVQNGWHADDFPRHLRPAMGLIALEREQAAANHGRTQGRAREPAIRQPAE